MTLTKNYNILILLILLTIVSLFEFLQSPLWGDVIDDNFKVAVNLEKGNENFLKQNFNIKVQLDIKDGYYVYADKFDIKIDPLEDLELTKKKSPPPIKKFDRFLNKETDIYVDSNIFTFILSVPLEKIKSFPLKKTIRVSYQGCSKSICYIPRTVDFEREFSLNSVKNISFGSFTGRLDSFLQKGFWLALIASFIIGIISSLTPCIYPILPIIVTVIASQASNNKLKSFLLSSVFTLGIALVYASTGIAAAKSGIVLGSLLQSIYIVLIVAGIFFAMGLSLIGLFEIKIPFFISRRLGNLNTKNQGYLGTFLAGMVTGIVAIPCIGPYAISILSFAAQSASIVKGFSLLFSFALGIGTIFIVVGTFSSVLVNIPKPGVWMIILKKVFGLILIGVSSYYLHLVISVSYFPIILGVIFLFLGLIFRKLSSPESPQIDWMNKAFSNLALILGILTLLFSSMFMQQAHKSLLHKHSLKDDQDNTLSGNKINWLSSYDEALNTASRTNKHLIIDFYADWCPSCVEMERTTFKNKRVVESSRDFVMLRLDLTNESDENARIANKYSILGLPALLILDPEGNIDKELSSAGYLDADDLLKIMSKITSKIKT